jgi:hypothetical protein
MKKPWTKDIENVRADLRSEMDAVYQLAAGKVFVETKVSLLRDETYDRLTELAEQVLGLAKTVRDLSWRVPDETKPKPAKTKKAGTK